MMTVSRLEDTGNGKISEFEESAKKVLVAEKD